MNACILARDSEIMEMGVRGGEDVIIFLYFVMTPPTVTAHFRPLRAAPLAFPRCPDPVSWEGQEVDAAYSGGVRACACVTYRFMCL